MKTEHPNADRTSLQKALRRFLDYKAKNTKESTVRAYRVACQQFLDYCRDEQELETISEVRHYHVNTWKEYRAKNVAPATVHNNVKHVRVFIGFCQEAGLVPQGTWESISVPELNREDAVSEESLSPEAANAALNYLDTYEYATRKHAQFLFMWHTGCRASGSIAVDVDDYEPSGSVPVVKFRDRPDTGTPLKNRSSSNRDVTLIDDVATVLNDYINGHRRDVTDDYGRNPLFTTPNGHVTRQRLYKNVTALTRPCYYANACPHDRSIEDCEAAKYTDKAMSCPSSVSNHPVRRGSINHHLDIGWPVEKLSERVDVSVKVLKKHYDTRGTERKRAGREDFMGLF